MQLKYKTIISVGVATGIGFLAGVQVGTQGIDWESQVHGIKNMYSTGNPITGAGPGVLSQEEAVSDFGIFWKAWVLLDDKFVPTTSSSTVDKRAKLIGAVSGLAGAYGDPYTMVFAEQNEVNFSEQVRGSFQGIGAVVGETPSGLQVGQILDGSPSQKAGLAPGDFVRAIDGKSTDGMKADAAVKLIRGQGGTVVTLRIVRPLLKPDAKGGVHEFDLVITRGTIIIPTTASAAKDVVRDLVRAIKDKVVAATGGSQSVSGKNVTAIITSQGDKQANDFYVFRLASFSGTSKDQVESELKKFKESGTHNLIIDLRGNPGGLVDMAVEISSHFLPKGAIIMSEVEGHDQKKITITSKGYHTFDGMSPRVVVLVDRYSASAAEILAAALRDNGKATLVGEKTFGKGSVQELLPLADKISLKVTVARWLTPKGEWISKVGVMPDIVVDPLTSKFKDMPDPVMAEAVARLLRN